MAAVHGKDGSVFIEGSDLSSYFRSMDVNRSSDTAETSTFKKTAKTKIGGLHDGTMSGEGLWDGDAGAVSEILDDLLGAADSVVAFYPAGDAVGSRGNCCESIETSHGITSDIGDAVGFSFEAEADGGVDPVTSLEAAATDVTASGNGTTVDNGAATSNGGSAYLQALSKSGGTSLDVTIRHSTDNFSGSDVLLATFTQVTAEQVAEKLTIAAGTTINQYVRAVYVEVGGGTWNVNVALHRAP